ncbi:dihydrofolate reductase family protein [Arthrobacter sp. ATA002]|uniref:dihydrofolate reductase family protein n=1 Tax=Arthrobacter sp. ATA002 TaxID=2991715 RepID=UPI0022A6B9BB|nr:dihydrofolate reductase family protein [Arthrobacter sp. ATA002]WAP53219.1 dihydrofolate reductase family protein [Arthrobacter sp. ATA002]
MTSLLGDHYLKFLDGVGAVAMGAGTYRSFLAATASWPYGSIPVWIFTHHEFPGIPGADIAFIRGEVAEFHPDIVYDAGEKDVLLAGGGNIASQFMDDGLIDELVFTVVPVALGSGRPMLPVGGITKPAVLLGTRSLGNGLVQLHYAFGSGEHAFGSGE